ncbi:MAG: nucleoside hydrolase [Verrucomicrobia bacterium]|nr:nucleoside hydrolase [Verrucomicrobiota bacterium]
MRRALLCLLLWLGAVLGRLPAESHVWIDTDCAFGPLTDSDDALALVQALHSPELVVRGISVSFGNSTVEASEQAVVGIVERFGAAAGVTRTMVHRGAASAADFARATPATEALAAELRQRRKLVYVALGPLTNLMTCLRRYPDLRKQLMAVVLVTTRQDGERLRVGRWNPFPLPDGNFRRDVPAMDAFLQLEEVPVMVVPPRFAVGLQLTPARLDALAASGPAWAWLAEQCRPWVRRWRWLFGVEGPPLFDGLGMLAASHPNYLPTDPFFVRIEHQRGRDVLIASPQAAGLDARVVLRVQPGAEDVIFERLRARPTAR